MILYTLYRKNYFFIHFENINLVNIRYSKHCVSLSRKRLAVHVLGRGGRYALPHRIEFDPLFSPPTGFGNNEEKRISESKASSILRYFSVYMERAHVNLLWIFRITRNTWRISPPLPANTRGSLAKLEKNLSRHGADNAISKRLAGGERENWLVTRQHALPPSCSLFIVTSFDELQSQPR